MMDFLLWRKTRLINEPKRPENQQREHRCVKQGLGLGSFAHTEQIADILPPQEPGEGDLQHRLDHKPGHRVYAYMLYPHGPQEAGIGVDLHRYPEDTDHDTRKNENPAPALSFIQEIEKKVEIDQGNDIDQEVNVQQVGRGFFVAPGPASSYIANPVRSGIYSTISGERYWDQA